MLRDGNVWLDGTVCSSCSTLVIRPLAIGPCSCSRGCGRGERLFVMFGGLKGAVPILLAALAVIAHVDHESYLYGVVYVVVLFSVAVQGTAMPTLATKLGIPFRIVAHELAEVREFTVAGSAFADGRRVEALPLAERAWVGGVRRDGGRVQVTGSLTLVPGDRVDVYCEPADEPALRRIFEGV